MIGDLITFLEANTESFSTIDHAWETEPVENVRELVPALFVFPGDDSTEEDGTDYLVSKRLHREINVYLVCAIADLDSLQTELRTALIGKALAPQYTDFALVSGKTISLKGGLIWWQDTYRAALTLRQAY